MRQLVLDAIKAHYTGSGLLSLDSINGGLWQELVQFATDESILGEMAVFFGGGNQTSSPSTSILNILLHFQRIAIAENDRRLLVLSETVKTLASAGVASLPLKGAAFLSSGLRPEARARSMADLDLLVNPSEIAKGVNVLKGVGYFPLVAEELYLVRDHHHAAPLSDPGGTIPIELHSRLVLPRRKNPLCAQLMFNEACIAHVGGVELLIPSPEHRLVHLVLHALLSNKGYALLQLSLRDLIDLLEFNESQLDWEKIQYYFTSVGFQDQAAGFFMAAEYLLKPAFRAPNWARGGKAWAEQAAKVYFHPQSFRTRRLLRRIRQDICALGSREHRSLAIHMLFNFRDVGGVMQRWLHLH